MNPDSYSFQTDPQSVHVIECPSCDAAREVVPVTVLYPESEELEALFTGELNRIRCQQCGQEFVLDVPILYRDDAARFMVYLLQIEEGSDWQASEEKMEELSEQIFGSHPDVAPPDCRLVTDRRSLIEKIALHQRGLDDHVIEYVKYQLANNPDESNRIDLVRHHLLFDFSADLNENLRFLVFDRESAEAVAGAHIPVEVYREIEETFRTSARMRQELDKLFPGFYVDVDRLQ